MSGSFETDVAALGVPAILVTPRSAECAPTAQALAEYVGARRDAWQQCAVGLFRGFEVTSAADFAALVAAGERSTDRYIGGNSPRVDLGAGVFTASEYDPQSEIILHQELSYEATMPARLWFCCLEPAPSGGATTLGDASAMHRTEPAIVEEFAARGVRYIQRIERGAGLGRSLEDTFAGRSSVDIEDYLLAEDASFHWEGECLVIERWRPAVRRHPRTGAALWCNQVDQWHHSSLPPAVQQSLQALGPAATPHHATFGDGEEIPSNMIAAIRNANAATAVPIDWQRGDVAVIDNIRLFHGRRPYRGPRRVIVSLSERHRV